MSCNTEQENTMRVSTLGVVISAFAVLALSANGASAGSLVPAAPKPVVPKINIQRNPHSTSNVSPPVYRQDGGYLHAEKVPGREKFGTITLNRGVVGDKTLQQWGQGVTGGGGVAYKGAAVTRCPGC
jgi:hypothetical protein